MELIAKELREQSYDSLGHWAATTHSRLLTCNANPISITRHIQTPRTVHEQILSNKTGAIFH